MEVVDRGHAYLVQTYDGDGALIPLTFMQREGRGYPGNQRHYGGTNCQEVLRVLIDRTRYLLRQAPCLETEAALHALETALALFELRAARRHQRTLALPSLAALEALTPCRTCGHVQCEGTHGSPPPEGA